MVANNNVLEKLFTWNMAHDTSFIFHFCLVLRMKSWFWKKLFDVQQKQWPEKEASKKKWRHKVFVSRTLRMHNTQLESLTFSKWMLSPRAKDNIWQRVNILSVKAKIEPKTQLKWEKVSKSYIKSGITQTEYSQYEHLMESRQLFTLFSSSSPSSSG